MTRYKLLYVLVFLLCYEYSVADQCPTAEVVKQRKISRSYEWTVDERKTLEDVLAVEKLYSVRIKNRGDFVACYYSGVKGIIRLDAKPGNTDCLIVQTSGNWESIDALESVCKEDNLDLCQFEAKCTE